MDGKNREEQENGAKVRDLEEYKAENRKRKRRRRITVGILAGAILSAGIGTGVWLQLRIFQGYDIVQATETEDTDTYMFQKSGNKIVRYGIDGIELRDRKNQTLWSDHYTMENPQMIWFGLLCSPSHLRMSVVRFRGMAISPSAFLILPRAV